MANDVIAFNADDFAAAAKGLRRAAARISHDFRREVRAAALPIAREIRNELPHAQAKGVKSSVKVSVTDKGAAILITRYAFAFTQGNVDHSHYKHKVYGRWSKSANTLMPTVPAAVDGPWEKGRVKATLAAEAALDVALRSL